MYLERTSLRYYCAAVFVLILLVHGNSDSSLPSSSSTDQSDPKVQVSVPNHLSVVEPSLCNPFDYVIQLTGLYFSSKI